MLPAMKSEWGQVAQVSVRIGREGDGMSVTPQKPFWSAEGWSERLEIVETGGQPSGSLSWFWRQKMKNTFRARVPRHMPESWPGEDDVKRRSVPVPLKKEKHFRLSELFSLPGEPSNRIIALFD